MSISLAEALEKVDLQAGQTYRCRVKEHWIEVRVLPGSELPPPSPIIVEDEGKLDPWIQLPLPEGGVRLRTKRGTELPIDIPYIPPEESDV
jgi:hypothetical protein